MAEDSGAFKTNPANSRQIPAVCDDPGRGVATKPHRVRKRLLACGGPFTPEIFNKRYECVAVF
jgi:hypothetical protein